jgi:hypothetical protein
MGMAAAQTWQMAPMQKTATERSRDLRRPKKSPAGAARRAPRAVPALKIATIIDESSGHMFTSFSRFCVVPLHFRANCFLNSFMAKIPLIALWNMLAQWNKIRHIGVQIEASSNERDQHIGIQE